MLQATEALKEVGEISKNQGIANAILIFVIVFGAGIMFWIIRYMLTAKERSEQRFVDALEKRDQAMKDFGKEMTASMTTAVKELQNEIRNQK